MSLLFDFIVDPLGLPIDWYYEYIIMAVVGLLAYELAFDKTGNLIARGIVSRGFGGSIAHWIIRLLFFVIIWAIIRAVIWINGFVKDNPYVSIFAGACILCLIGTVLFFRRRDRQHEKLR